MNVTPAIQPPDEPCTEAEVSPSEVLVSINEALYPDEVLDPPSEARIPLSQALTMIRRAGDINPLIGFYDQQTPFRLISTLRGAAQTQHPYRILARAARAFYSAQHPTTGSSPKEDVKLGNALADLAVTGRVAYTAFKNPPLSEAAVRNSIRNWLTPSLPPPTTYAEVDDAISPALDRAYAVAWALRGPAAQQAAARAPLGWIAVSSDDDKPHRPVNIPPPPFEQFEIPVTVAVGPAGATPTVTIQTRFFIASAADDDAPATIPPSPRTLPPDPVPRVPAGHLVILFLHGHSSSAEEALDIIPHILKASLDRGRKYSIISLDLPNNGYSETFAHERIANPRGTSWPSAPGDFTVLLRTPILDYIENFVVAFVDALHEKTPIKNRFAGVIGGSLGGNLGLRLGQRDLTASPWLGAGIVSWSAASVWKPMVNSVFNSIAPGVCWGRSIEPENAGSRSEYFSGVYDKPAVWTAGSRTQPQMWYRDNWEPCKARKIRESRIARQEIYDANFRQWHWRVACEQLIFSHIDRVAHGDNNTPWRYERNKARQLLIAGEKDDFTGTHIFRRTRELSALMVGTPGRSLFLKDTGHSMHIERPIFLAGQIVDFLPGPRRADVSFLTPLLLGGPG